MPTLEDYENWREALAKGLECPPSLPDISAAIGALRAKADERDELTERVRRDVQAISALLPTTDDLADLRSGLEDPRRPLSERLDEIRTRLAGLRRYAEGLE